MSELILPRLGELLVTDGVISPGRMQHALGLQQRHGGRLGNILIGEGMIGYFDLYRVLAKQEGMPFIDLLKTPPDIHLLTFNDVQDYLHLGLLPYCLTGGIMTIALCEHSPEVMAWIATHYGPHVHLVMTSPYDIRKTIEREFGDVFEENSRLALWRKTPDASAHDTFTLAQKKIAAIAAFIMLQVVTLYPTQSALCFIIFCQCAYALTMVFKCLIFVTSIKTPLRNTWEEKLATLTPKDLPIYTVLIPMYKEAASLPGLLQSLQTFDYPKHKLDIKLVIESDDDETLKAAQFLNPSHRFEIVRVPLSDLRTKPKACNYALRFARGEYVTVFDADDHPDPLQLKKAVYTFRHSPPDVVCLQARLNYYNAEKNLLTRFFAIEYTTLFHFMLPGLECLRIPIPLGGTSNHIALNKLVSAGEWDPYNVTEDADLGTRFAARGYRTVVLDSTTMEEAPHNCKAWIRQRSRWLKGYMQTWLVYMRHPVVLCRTLGLQGFIGFLFFVGFSTFSYLSAPIIWILGWLWAEKLLQSHHLFFSDWLIELCGLNMAFNVLSLWGFAACSLLRSHTTSRYTFVTILLYPIYMVLHSIASYKALWQLIFRPHFWEKTTHGLAIPFARRYLKRMRLITPPVALKSSA